MNSMNSEAAYEHDYVRMLQASEYTLRHLAQHLHNSGQNHKLYHLLTANRAWMDAKSARLTGDAAYIADLELALGDFADPLTADQAFSLVQLWTARICVQTQVNVYTDSDLQTLVFLGRDAEALTNAALRVEEMDRLKGLMAILKVTHEQQAINEPLLNQVWNSARGLPNSFARSKGLHLIAVFLAEVGRLDDALDAASEIDVPDDRIPALCTIGVALARAGDIRTQRAFSEAQELASNIKYPKNHGDALKALAFALAEIGDHNAISIFEDAISEQTAVFNEGSLGYAMWRSELAVVYARLGFLEDSLEIARDLVSTFLGAQPLCAVAAALAQSDQVAAPTVVAEALEIAYQVEHGIRRATVLREIAAVLANMGDDSSLNIFEEAQLAAEQLSPGDRQLSLTGIASQLAQAGYFDPALAILDKLDDAERRADVLRNLAVAMARAGDQRAAQTLRSAIDTELARQPYSSANDWVLRYICTVLAESGLIDGVLEVVDRISDGHALAEALCDTASAAARLNRTEDALAIAERITDNTQHENALRGIAVAFIEAGNYSEAQKIIEAIPQIPKFDPVLLSIGVALSKTDNEAQAEIIFDDARKAAHEIQSPIDFNPGFALRNLAIALAKARRVNDALEITAEIKDLDTRALGLNQIALELTRNNEPGAEVIFDEALQAARNTPGDGYTRAIALGEIAATLIGREDFSATKIFDEAIEIAHHADYGALPKVVDHLGRAGLFALAFRTLGLTNLEEHLRFLVASRAAFVRLAPDLPLRVLSEATRIATWSREDWRNGYLLLSRITDPPEG